GMRRSAARFLSVAHPRDHTPRSSSRARVENAPCAALAPSSLSRTAGPLLARTRTALFSTSQKNEPSGTRAGWPPRKPRALAFQAPPKQRAAHCPPSSGFRHERAAASSTARNDERRKRGRSLPRTRGSKRRALPQRRACREECGGEYTPKKARRALPSIVVCGY